jgi:preprotein translocase subunit SecD
MKRLVMLFLSVLIIFASCSDNDGENSYVGQHYKLSFRPADSFTPNTEEIEETIAILKPRAMKYNENASVVAEGDIINVDIEKTNENWYVGESLIRDKLMYNAKLLFVKGDAEQSQDLKDVILTGEDVVTVSPLEVEDATKKSQIVLSFEFNAEGKEKFANATTELAKEEGKISIWLGDSCISVFTVNTPLLDGKTYVSGGFTAEYAQAVVEAINTEMLPYELEIVK